MCTALFGVCDLSFVIETDSNQSIESAGVAHLSREKMQRIKNWGKNNQTLISMGVCNTILSAYTKYRHL